MQLPGIFSKPQEAEGKWNCWFTFFITSKGITGFSGTHFSSEALPVLGNCSETVTRATGKMVPLHFTSELSRCYFSAYGVGCCVIIPGLLSSLANSPTNAPHTKVTNKYIAFTGINDTSWTRLHRYNWGEIEKRGLIEVEVLNSLSPSLEGPPEGVAREGSPGFSLQPAWCVPVLHICLRNLTGTRLWFLWCCFN